MKSRSIHKNLDTSFVSLASLIKYLRRRQFVGVVKVKLNGYEADVQINEDDSLRIHEHDKISGRTARGKEAFQRLLIRSKEPGGTIDVYQIVYENQPVSEKTKEVAESTNGNAQEAKIEIRKPQTNGSHATKTTEKVQNASQNLQKNQKTSLPNFPFRLSNQFEEKAKQVESSVEDWNLLLKLTVELLRVIDTSIAKAKLDFSAAFKKACSEVADDYPFLNPKLEKFAYSNGKLKMTEKVNAKIFVAGIMEVLRRILEKLGSDPKFTEVYRSTVQKALAVMHKRKEYYDQFSITPHLKRILGA